MGDTKTKIYFVKTVIFDRLSGYQKRVPQK